MSLSQLGAGEMEGPSPPLQWRLIGPGEAIPLAALVWVPSADSRAVPTGQASGGMEVVESRTECPLSFPEEPYLKPCWSRNVGFLWAKWQWLAETTQLQTLTGGRRKNGAKAVYWGGRQRASVALPSTSMRSLWAPL